MDYTIIGGGVNLASRLETAATPGEILISYETRAHVKDKIQCEDHGEVNVKGIAYPVATYQVVDSHEPCLSGYHPHPLYVVCLLGLQARAGAGALRRRSG